jgi:CYTH domain-containing protein
LNKKYIDKLVAGKVEVEQRLTKKEFEAYLAHALPNSFWPLRKKRYYIPYNGLTIELDCFDKTLDNLIIAEVEFTTLAEFAAFVVPDRFGKEISGVVSNKKLYLSGLDALKSTSKTSPHHPALKRTKKHIYETKDHLKKLKKKI